MIENNHYESGDSQHQTGHSFMVSNAQIEVTTSYVYQGDEDSFEMDYGTETMTFDLEINDNEEFPSRESAEDYIKEKMKEMSF